MKTNLEALKAVYVKNGGSLTDTYEDIAGGAPVSAYKTLKDAIAALSKLTLGGGSGLPDVTAEDNGKTVYVDNGEWEVGYSEIPNVALSTNATVLDLSSGTDFIKKLIPFSISFGSGSNDNKYLIYPSVREDNLHVNFIYYKNTSDWETPFYGHFERTEDGVYISPRGYSSYTIANYLRFVENKSSPTFSSSVSESTTGFVYGDYSYVAIKTPDEINGIGIYTVDLSDAKSQFDIILSSLKTAASASANTHITKYMPLTGELAAYTGLIIRNAANAYNVNGKTIVIKYGDLITSLGGVALDSDYVGYLSYGIVEPDTVSKKLYEITVLLSSTGFESAEAYFDVVCRSATVISQ